MDDDIELDQHFFHWNKKDMLTMFKLLEKIEEQENLLEIQEQLIIDKIEELKRATTKEHQVL